MRRREFTKLAAATIAWPMVANAQKPMPVIGFLSSTSPGPNAFQVGAFRQGLIETGYVEGKNLATEYRWAENQEDRCRGRSKFRPLRRRRRQASGYRQSKG